MPIMSCSICLDSLKNPYQLNCSHEFCITCIRKWNQKSGKCPLCRIEITQDLNPYNLRKFKKNECIKVLKKFISDFNNTNNKPESLIILNKIFIFLSQNKYFINNNDILKKIVLERIKYFKEIESVPQAYYWDHLING